MTTWDDIEKALAKGTIEQLDKATLEAFAAVEPRASGNPAYHLRFEQAQLRIGRAIERINAKEREENEAVRHREIQECLEELKKPHWTVNPNFWITLVSAIAAIVAAYFAWRALPPAVPSPQPAGVGSPSSSLPTQQPSPLLQGQ